MNNNKLFEKYINPELGFIKNVCWKYWTRTIEFEELHNEILAIIFRYIHTYNPSKPIRPWLYTVIGREMHRLQKHTWQAPIEYVDLEQYPFSHIQVENDEFAYEDLYVAIESLSPLLNEIISLRMSGYTIKDIAEILYERGLMISNSVNIVSSRINEAYSGLASVLSRNGTLLRLVKPHSQPFKECPKPLGVSQPPTTSVKIKTQKSNHRKQMIEKTPTLTIENHMAKLKSELDKWISMPDRDYLDLVEDHIMMTALRTAGIEQLPIYKSAQSILKNNHIEVHLKPIKPQYKGEKVNLEGLKQLLYSMAQECG